MERNVAVVGCGAWGRNLVRNFSQLGALHTICDSDSGVRKALQSQYSPVNAEADWQKVLDNAEVKGVVIATPPVHHYRMVKAALLSNKDVFVEKPLCLEVKEGKELVKIAEEKKRVLMVGHLLEYHPAVVKLKELVAKGELGKLHYVYSNRLNLGRFRTQENVLWDLAPHDVSLVLLLLNGEMPRELSAHGGYYLNKDIADIALVNMGFKGGVRAHIFTSWFSPFKEHKLVVVGDSKMAVFNDTSPKDKLQLYSYRIQEMKGETSSQLGEAEVIEFPREEPLNKECRDFLQCMNTRQKPRVDGIKGLRVMEIIAWCQKSLEKNGKIINLDGLT